MNDKALIQAYRELHTLHAKIADVYARLADAGASSDRKPTSPTALPPVTEHTPVADRELRQALVVKAVLDAGGSVPKERYVDVDGVSVHDGDIVAIANEYGYHGRALAGFYRNTTNSLLRLNKNTGKVTVTPYGRAKLKTHAERVAEFPPFSSRAA